MNIFWMQFKNEMKKIVKHKKFTVLLLIEILICAGAGLSTYLIGKASSETILVANFAFRGITLSMLSFFMQVYIPLIIIMNACDLFNLEFNDLTIKASFMRPISRFKIYFAKVSALFVSATIYIFTLFVVTNIIAKIGGGLTRGSANLRNFDFIRDFFIYFVDLIPILIFVLFVAMLMQIFKGATLAILLSIVICVLLNIAAILQPSLGVMLFTNYMQWHKLFFGIAVPFATVVNKLALLSGYTFIFAGLGYYLFERREL
ncbi:MAG: ABC transporter permease subunit [Eubacteriales bacterium]